MKRERIFYKIVHNPSRSSYCVHLTSRYLFGYPQGAILTAPSESFGFFGFDSIENAEAFIQSKHHDIRRDQLLILTIKALAPIRHVSEIYSWSSVHVAYSFKKAKKRIPKACRAYAPIGTVVCKKIEVLD